ncbi:MAG: muramoyltetrapeptide carboxypeptidase [Myxococcota bacterium]|jgi:muramoyltetrapeptide carboxypeptidase
MIRPKPLRAGARIGIVAPAGPAPVERVQAGIDVLESLGFSVAFDPPPPGPRHYLAGDDGARAAALEHAFMDPAIHGVWAVRGGFGCARTVRTMNLRAVGFNPKPLIGFSDLTALLLSVTGACEIETFHGPVITQLPNLDARSIEQMAAMLAGEAGSIELDADREVLRSGTATGRLVGGNLSVLVSLLGTRNFPQLSGKILFLEDVGEPAYRVDRMLTQLRLSGVLANVGGVVIGRFTGVADGEVETFDNLWAEFAGFVDGPVVRGLAIGHLSENLTIPVGRLARLSSNSSVIELL